MCSSYDIEFILNIYKLWLLILKVHFTHKNETWLRELDLIFVCAWTPFTLYTLSWILCISEKFDLKINLRFGNFRLVQLIEENSKQCKEPKRKVFCLKQLWKERGAKWFCLAKLSEIKLEILRKLNWKWKRSSCWFYEFFYAYECILFQKTMFFVWLKHKTDDDLFSVRLCTPLLLSCTHFQYLCVYIFAIVLGWISFLSLLSLILFSINFSAQLPLWYH